VKVAETTAARQQFCSTQKWTNWKVLFPTLYVSIATLFNNGRERCCSPCRNGKNTSTVIPASRRRRRKGNPVVSNETVMYNYESSVTPITDRLHYKLQTRPLIREGPQDEEQSNFSAKQKEKVKSCHGS
jgi:hypothetical protein